MSLNRYISIIWIYFLFELMFGFNRILLYFKIVARGFFMVIISLGYYLNHTHVFNFHRSYFHFIVPLIKTLSLSIYNKQCLNLDSHTRFQSNLTIAQLLLQFQWQPLTIQLIPGLVIFARLQDQVCLHLAIQTSLQTQLSQLNLRIPNFHLLTLQLHSYSLLLLTQQVLMRTSNGQTQHIALHDCHMTWRYLESFSMIANALHY